MLMVLMLLLHPAVELAACCCHVSCVYCCILGPRSPTYSAAAHAGHLGLRVRAALCAHHSHTVALCGT